MKRTYRVIGTHLIVQLIYSRVLSLLYYQEQAKSNHHPNYAASGFVVFMFGAIAIHIFITLLVVLIGNKDDLELRKANLLGMLVILLIGASICFSVSSIL